MAGIMGFGGIQSMLPLTSYAQETPAFSATDEQSVSTITYGAGVSEDGELVPVPLTEVLETQTTAPAESAVAPTRFVPEKIGDLATKNIEINNLSTNYGEVINPADFANLSEVAIEKGVKFRLNILQNKQELDEKILQGRNLQQLDYQKENYIELVVGGAGGLIGVGNYYERISPDGIREMYVGLDDDARQKIEVQENDAWNPEYSNPAFRFKRVNRDISYAVITSIEYNNIMYRNAPFPRDAQGRILRDDQGQVIPPPIDERLKALYEPASVTAHWGN